MDGMRPSLVLFFSDDELFPDVARELSRRFPAATVIGASTFASFSPGGLCRHGLNVAALEGGVHVSSGLIREVTRHPGLIYDDVVRDALAAIEPGGVAVGETCCLVMNPSGTASEELVLDVLARALDGTGIPVFGGSASSDVCVRGSVSLDGNVYSNSSVFALVSIEGEAIDICQENVFRPMGGGFRVTGSDVGRRTLHELDGRPAADVLCEALGVEPDGLAAALAEHPLGRVPKGQLFIDEVERIAGDGGIVTYCRILEGSEVVLLEARDFPTTMGDTLERIHAHLDRIDFALAVNCFSRTQMYLRNGWMDEFCERMSGSLGSYVGLTSHGEQLGRYQLNLTLLVLSFGHARAGRG